MGEQGLDKAPRKVFQNAQSGFLSVVHKVIEQVKLYLHRKGVIRETLNTHFAKYFNVYAAAGVFSESLITSSSFMEQLRTLATHEMYSETEKKKYSVPYTLQQLMDTIELCKRRE